MAKEKKLSHPESVCKRGHCWPDYIYATIEYQTKAKSEMQTARSSVAMSVVGTPESEKTQSAGVASVYLIDVGTILNSQEAVISQGQAKCDSISSALNN